MMMPEASTMAAWLATVVLHGSVALAVAWAIDRYTRPKHLATREALWTVALYFGWITATLQFAFVPSPLSGRWTVLPAVAPLTVGYSAPTPMPSAQSAAGDLASIAPSAIVTVAAAKSSKSKPTALAPKATAPAPVATAAAVQSQSRNSYSSTWRALLLPGWLLLVALGALRSLWLLASFLRTTQPSTDPRLHALVGPLAARAGIAMPRLLQSVDLSTPIATFNNQLCLPTWAIDQLDRRQLSAMLAHEIAHLSRRDPLWRSLAALAHALMLFHPLAGLARRRLDAIAEFSCDAWAAEATGDGRALVECLAHVLERAPGHALPLPAAAMATPNSPLLQRAERLLEEIPMKTQSLSWRNRAVIAAVIVSATVLLPALATRQLAMAGEHHSLHISSSDLGFGKTTTISFDHDGVDFVAKAHGDFDFNDAETDVGTLDKGGTLYMEETRSGTTRRVEFANTDGTISKAYKVDGGSKAFDADAQKWLTQIIGEVLRSGFNAEGRVKRLLAKGGPEAVIAEAEKMGSDYPRRVYLETLADQATLNPAQVDRVIAVGARVGSDFDRRSMLTALIEHQTLAAAQQVAALKSVATMDSDFDQRSVLEAIAPKLADDHAVQQAWGEALNHIDSAFDRRSAIEALTSNKPSHGAVSMAFAGARTIDSDFDRREALTALLPHIGGDMALIIEYTRAVADMDSDFDRREALIGLIETAPKTSEAFAAILDAASHIGSDFDCRETLTAIAEHMPADAQLIKRYRAIARKLSDYDRGQAEKALDRFEV